LTKKYTDYEWFVKRGNGESFGDATCAKTEENVLKLRTLFGTFSTTTIFARAKSSTPKIVPSA
jgi:hypothetical protein